MASFPVTGTKTFRILPSPQSTSLHPHPPISFKTYKKPAPLKWILLSSSSGAVTASSSEPNSPFSSPSTSPSSLYSAKVYELTAENVNMVLDDVRPYLIADGGDVDVVGVDDGVVSLQLQGACGSCASSTTTMKMGIERVLKEKFGDAIKEIRQVSNELQTSITDVVAVNRHLDILRPAIKNYGGSVQVISIENGDCHVKYVGPDSIGSGIRAAIKEKFPDIVNIIFITDD